MKLPALALVMSAGVAISSCISLPASSAEPADKISELNHSIEQVMSDWKVPGVSVLVMKDDKVVLSRGFGVTKQGGNEKVDDQTIFAIGSCTKAFTSTAISMLKDENKLGFDDPIVRFIPTLALYDPYVTNQIDIRDCLALRSGLEQGQTMVALGNLDTAEIIRRMRFFKALAPFRYKWTYVNALYVLAGETISRTASKPWADFINSRIIEPLHMTRTNTSVKKLSSLTNVASPHHMETITDVPTPVPYFDCEAIAPAGGINSCAADLAPWLKLQMNDGKFEGQQLVGASSLAQTHQPQMLVEGGTDLCSFPEAQIKYTAYCMGWGTYQYRGHKELTHTGGIDGMRASVTMLPDDHLALAVLSNSDYGDGRPQEIIKDYITDCFLNLSPIEWNKKFLQLQKSGEAKQSAENARLTGERVMNTKPSHPLKDYTGIFENDLYGQVKIEEQNDKLIFSWPRSPATSEHWHFDTFKVTFGNKVLGSAFATFDQSVEGKIQAVDFPAIGTFKRR